MQKITELLGDHSPFLEKLFSFLKTDNIDTTNYELDHVCYRVETLKRYLELKEKISRHASILSETPIAGRPIATFKLDEPLIFENRKIFCLELPAPKEISDYKEGYEHAEFVIDTDFQNFMDAHQNVKFETKYLEKKINPDIGIKYDGVSVKFHHHTLEYVITYLE